MTDTSGEAGLHRRSIELPCPPGRIVYTSSLASLCISVGDLLPEHSRKIDSVYLCKPSYCVVPKPALAVTSVGT